MAPSTDHSVLPTSAADGCYYENILTFEFWGWVSSKLLSLLSYSIF